MITRERLCGKGIDARKGTIEFAVEQYKTLA